MSKIRIDFCDMGYNSPKMENFLYKVLSERFDLDLCDQPDFLIYSVAGHAHRLHSGVKIFYSHESDVPNYNECDYSIGSAKVADPRHLQLPCYVSLGTISKTADPTLILKAKDEHERILASKAKFCSFIISGYNPRKNGNRVEFFHKLSKYKKVDSGGRKFNNIGGPIPGKSEGKIEFLRAYKFNIAYENRSLAGYTTEKIFQPMIARCMPIYWGDPEINDHFNPRSFLNRADFVSDEALIEKIIELDKDDQKYLEYMRQPYFHNDQPNRFFDRKRIQDFFEKVFSQKITPVAQRRGKSFFFGRLSGRWKLAKRYHWHEVQGPGW